MLGQDRVHLFTKFQDLSCVDFNVGRLDLAVFTDPPALGAPGAGAAKLGGGRVAARPGVGLDPGRRRAGRPFRCRRGSSGLPNHRSALLFLITGAIGFDGWSKANAACRGGYFPR